MSLYQRRYYKQNKERIKANYLKNRQHFQKYKRQYYQNNKETIFFKISIKEKLQEIRLMSCPGPSKYTIIILELISGTLGAVWSVMTLIYHFSLLVKLRLLCDRIAETVISSTPVELIGDRIKFKFYGSRQTYGLCERIRGEG